MSESEDQKALENAAEIAPVFATDERLARKGLSLASVGGSNPPRVVSADSDEEPPKWREWKLIRDDKKGIAAMISRMLMPNFPRFSIEMRFFRPEHPHLLYRHFQPFSQLIDDVVTITEVNFLAMRMVWEEAQNLIREELQIQHNKKVQKFKAKMAAMLEAK